MSQQGFSTTKKTKRYRVVLDEVLLICFTKYLKKLEKMEVLSILVVQDVFLLNVIGQQCISILDSFIR